MRKFWQVVRGVLVHKNNNTGGALALVMVIASIVAAGGLILTNSGQIISITGKSNNERTLIDNVKQDIEIALADRNACTTARAGNYAEIGNYQRGQRIDQTANNDGTISQITVDWDPVPPALPLNAALGANVRTLTLTFTVTNNTRGVRTVRREVYIQEFQTNVDAAGPAEQFCMSFQPNATENVVSNFCTQIGGIAGADGSCNLDAPGNPVLQDVNIDFTERLREFACNLIGGVYDTNTDNCDQLNVAGPIHSDNFFNRDNPPGSPDQIVLDDSGTIRSNFLDFDCPAGSVATGFAADGTLQCDPIDCNAAFTNGSEPVYSDYVLGGSGGTLRCECMRNFKFGDNRHNVTLTPPVDSNRYNTGSESPAADVHSMISPFKKPTDYNGTAVSNNDKTVGCFDEDPYACRDYEWNDGCALGTTCTILRGRFPGCGVTTTSEEKVIVNSCNDICAVGPNCDNNLNEPRTDGCVVENDPEPPTISCTGQTVAGTCAVPDAGADSADVPGTCAGGQVGTCTVSCDETGTWGTPNVSGCSALVSECNGLPDTTEYDNGPACTTETPGPITNFYSCEVRGTKYCRLGRTCDRSTLSIPNSTLSSTSGKDDADQPYGGTIVCDDAGAPPTVTCDGSNGNYNIVGSCGSVATCNPSTVTWGSGSCTADITNIYSEGALVTVTDNISSMQGTADFTCNSAGSWDVVSETCTSSGGPCPNSGLTVANATVNPSSGVTANGSNFSGTISCNSGYAGGATASCDNSSWNISGGCVASGLNSCQIRAYVGGMQVLTGEFNQVLFPGESETVTNAQHSTYNTDCIGNGTAVCNITSISGGRTYSCSLPSVSCANSSAPSVTNGSFPGTGTTSHLGTLNGSCNSGYTGSPKTVCDNGSFNSPTGSCSPVSTACPSGTITAAWVESQFPWPYFVDSHSPGTFPSSTEGTSFVINVNYINDPDDYSPCAMDNSCPPATSGTDSGTFECQSGSWVKTD